MLKAKLLSALALAAMTFTGVAQANVTLPKIFTSNMVLQREKPVKVWGWAAPQEEITVEFAGQSVKGTADAKGDWEVTLQPLAVSKENRDFVVKGKNTITLKNVLVGDVWLCSGQSNMEMSFSWGIMDGDREIAESAKYPLIRHIKVSKGKGDYAKDVRTDCQWFVCEPKNMKMVTAAGYFFARKLHQETGIPMGILADNWSGCRIEPFTAPEGFAKVPELKSYADALAKCDLSTPAGKEAYAKAIAEYKKWIVDAEKRIAAGEKPAKMPAFPGYNNGACSQYAMMIEPIVRFPIKGAIWYQGCSNANDGEFYFFKSKALIEGWRAKWGYDFPFYIVQLASFRGKNNTPAGGDGYAMVREAQRRCLTLPKTGLAVTIDIGNTNDIHPKDKRDVGLRLAAWALHNDYGKKDVIPSGPAFKEAKAEGGKMRVSFDYADCGLMVGNIAIPETCQNWTKTPVPELKEIPGGKLEGFAIAGADKKFVWADAVIDGNDVVVSSPAVKAPVAVRYAFRGNAMGKCNLYNKAGLPAIPFRSDNKW